MFVDQRRAALHTRVVDRVKKAVVWRALVVALFAQAVVVLVMESEAVFAAILVLVGCKLGSDRDWLLVPIIINGIAFGSVIAETLAEQAGQGPAVLRPFLTHGSFLAIYAVGYRLLRPERRHDGRPPSRNKGIGWGFDRWGG
jgi:hypothetical protein